MAIILPSGFNITNNEPVDARFSLADQTARYGLSSANIYEGLVVYQRDTNTLWILIDTAEVSNSNGWQAAASSEASGIIDARLDTIENFTSSTSARLNSIETITSSNTARINSLETFSASVDTLNTAQDSRLTSLEIKTGSLATTGSNTFNGNQTISGSLYIRQDLIVEGSSSIQNISSSTLNIGTNLITVATNNQSVRFGGLVVIDSGSIGGSGSFLYDSLQDEFIFVHRGANTTVTSSVFLMGPQTFDTIGSETYLTSNRILKGTGNEHIVDSNITDTGTLITLGSNTTINGTVVSTGTTLVSG